MSSIHHVSAVVPAEEVDFFTLFQVLKKQRRLIFGATLIIGAMAGAYAMFKTPIYQVSSVLRPAAINELDALNRSEIYKLPPSEALLKVGASLDSYETRLGFFRANPSLFQAFKRSGQTLEQSFEEFNRDSVRLVLPDPKKNDLLSSYIALELNYPKGVDGAAILNGLVDYAISSERGHISADLKVIINNRLDELKGKIAAARSNYETEKEARVASLLEADNLKRDRLQDELKALRLQLRTTRADRIAQLSEAIGVAKSLGIQKPTTPSTFADTSLSGSGSVMRTEVNNQPVPLYFLGVDALEAEQRALQQRKSDDFSEERVAQIGKELELLKTNREVEVLSQRKNEDIFLNGVQPLRAEIARLRGLNINMENLKLVSIDRPALEPASPLKPRKTLIVSLGLFFGCLLGVFLAIVRHFFVAQQPREQGVSSSALASSSEIFPSQMRNLCKSDN